MIRKVDKEDYDNIYSLVKKAFETAKVTNGNEQNFVYELRDRDTYLADLEFVIEEENMLVAHIMLTEQKIDCANTELPSVIVAPLCVKEEYRNKGLGNKLLKYSIQKAKEKGYKIVFLVGDPNYYTKYGFKSITNYMLENLSEVPDEYVLVYEIEINVLEGVTGKVDLH